ncbi:theg spermatid protein [Oryzias melastigma]|uniref:theg spermatid protein n=1 Tax=Oryzias melastigma TaxID=30732 RepID=UPI000CF7EA43|nr:theg spermatid protein [Oryzias melastigma]
MSARSNDSCKAAPVSMTIRMQQLAQPKLNQLRYPDRLSLWEVSERALTAVASKRLCHLANPKSPVSAWQPDRPLPVPVSRGTQSAVASVRICQLAQPKKRSILEGSSYKSKPGPLTRSTSKAVAHIELLATPKRDHPNFESDRSVFWPVSRGARNYRASQRMIELSQPKERKALFEGYNPYAVSRGALSASPSHRIQELSLPLLRKCISK